MTVLGVIGVGTLADYTIRGLRRGGWRGEIVLSPRNSTVSTALAADCRCKIVSDNAAVAAACDWLMLSVRGPSMSDALAGLSLRPGQTLISCMAGVTVSDIAAFAGDAGRIARAMPVTAAEIGASPTAVYPADPDLLAFFDHIGPTVPTPDEQAFNAGTILACVYVWYLDLFDRVSREAHKAGLPSDLARSMTLDMAKAAAEIASARPDRNLADIVAGLALEGSFSKLGLDHLDSSGALDTWSEAFALLRKRL